MKVAIILISVLSGLLYSELKEFFSNGGLDNKLAMTLLKISFLTLFMQLCAMLYINNSRFLEKEASSGQNATIVEEVDSRTNAKEEKPSRSRSRRRLNRFSDMNTD